MAEWAGTVGLPDMIPRAREQAAQRGFTTRDLTIECKRVLINLVLDRILLYVRLYRT